MPLAGKRITRAYRNGDQTIVIVAHAPGRVGTNEAGQEVLDEALETFAYPAGTTPEAIIDDLTARFDTPQARAAHREMASGKAAASRAVAGLEGHEFGRDGG